MMLPFVIIAFKQPFYCQNVPKKLIGKKIEYFCTPKLR